MTRTDDPPDDPPVVGEAGDGTWDHPRPLVFLAIGTVLAMVLAVVLFVGVGTGGHGRAATPSIGQQATAANLEPGINGPTSLLLSLTVLPRPYRAAPAFSLTDQRGQPVSPARFRGKVVVVMPNDDRCVDLCTLLANDIVVANRDLGAAARHVVWLSVNANPFYPQVSAVKAFTDSHGLAGQPNWYFGTGTPTLLAQTWAKYGFAVETDPTTRTITHSTELFYLDPSGTERAVAEFGTQAADTSLFAHGMAQMANDLLPRDQQVRVAGPETPAPNAHNATVSAVAPNFRLPYLAGGRGTFDLASLRGRYAVVNFFSSTCTVCRVELPHIEAAYRATGSKVAFVGVDVADAAAPGLALARAAGLTYPLVADRQGVAAGSEAISGLPFTVVISPTGRIVVRHPGAFTTQQLAFILDHYVPALAAQG